MSRQLISDAEIVAAVYHYRQEVNDKYGPVSLDVLADCIFDMYTHIRWPPVKSNLSVRINQLIKGKYLDAIESPKGTISATLTVTPQGLSLIAKDTFAEAHYG